MLATNQSLKKHRLNQLEWLEFDLLKDFPRVKHALFLRQGGCSQGLYASLNTGFHVGDKMEDVAANVALVQEQLKIECPGWQNYVDGLQYMANRLLLSLNNPLKKWRDTMDCSHPLQT